MSRERFEAIETCHRHGTAIFDILLLEMLQEFHEGMIDQRCLAEIENDFLFGFKLGQYLLEADQVGKYRGILNVHIVLISRLLQLIARREKVAERCTIYDMEDKLDENTCPDTHQQVAGDCHRNR